MRHRTGAISGAHGASIFTQSWSPDGHVTGTLVIAHGLGEHSGRYAALAERLVGAGWSVHALDHRGHGRSPGRRADVEQFALVIEDLDRLVTAARQDSGGGPVVLLGHSMGGAIALAYALEHQSKLDGLALSGPALALGDDAPRTQVKLVQMLAKVLPGLGALALPPEDVSRDPAVVKAYIEDPLVHHGRVPARTLAELTQMMATFPQRIDRLRLPVLVQHGTADRLVELAAVRPLYDRIGSSDLTVHLYDGLYHEIFNEPERDRVIADLEHWLSERFGSSASASL